MWKISAHNEGVNAGGDDDEQGGFDVDSPCWTSAAKGTTNRGAPRRAACSVANVGDDEVGSVREKRGKRGLMLDELLAARLIYPRGSSFRHAQAASITQRVDQCL